jgi:hypothetical protein
MKTRINHQEQINTAVQLARTAADTATALASAKVQSDIVAAYGIYELGKLTI